MLQFKIRLNSMRVFPYAENGISFAMVFQDLHGPAPKCRLVSGTTTPLMGYTKFSNETIWDYGKNLLFEPIPLELLYTDAKNPQVLVSVNGIDGVCPNFNCDYTYVNPVGEITGQTLTGLDLVVQGTELPTESVSVKIANSKCVTVTATATEITCTLDVPAAAGSWNVEVTSTNGLIPLASGVAKIRVLLTVQSVTPSSNLNQLGGDELTFTGSGFDMVTENTQVKFSDGTACVVKSTSSTSLKCLVSGFLSSAIDTVNPYTVNVTVNGELDRTQSVMLKSTKQSGLAVAPNSVSPVLSTELTVTLEATYPFPLVASDFTVRLVGKTNSTIVRPLYVVSVDDSAKSIKIKYPGAESGFYYVQVESKQIGRID